MRQGAFQVNVKDNWDLSEQLQKAAFKTGYFWAGTNSKVSARGGFWLIFEPDHKHIYYSSTASHQPQYGPEIPSAEAFRRFNGIDFQGIDCTIPEGDGL